MINFIKISKWWIGLLFIIAFQISSFAQGEINAYGSFEQMLPSYWTVGSPEGVGTLSWATDQSRSMGRSLKIEKGTTSEAAMWESENMVDLWSDKHFANVDIKFGMYYMTSGVNINPATEDEKWYVSFTFYREDGSEIGATKFELDQTAASTGGWVADTTAIGAVILPEDSWTTIIRFVGGKDATGTVWTDDYIFYGRDGWAGQDWNTAVGVPTGWFYWLPPIGGNDGILEDGYQNTVVTNEDSYHGDYSLKFDMLEGTHDGFVGTRRYALNGGAGPTAGSESGLNDITTLNAVPGDVLRISVWIKGENLFPDSVLAYGDQWTIALTPIFHDVIGNNAGWGQIFGADIPLTFPNATSFDWTQYYADVEVVENAVALSVRLHPLGLFQGTVWMDALEIKIIQATDVEDESVPTEYSIFQNYPNPFNPSTIISYTVPRTSYVTIKIYDMLGREVRTLLESEQNAGIFNIQWNGDNNFGSKVSSGTYIYMIKAGEFFQAKKMIFLK
jgi:hypothetical protein